MNGFETWTGILVLSAEIVDDLEKSRIANTNRLAALYRDHGQGDESPQVIAMKELIAELAKVEELGIKNLKSVMRQHPLGPWVERNIGLGEKTVARLLGAVGDPYMRPEMKYDDGTVEPQRPRKLAELRSYCGWGDAKVQRRRSGKKANWNSTARMRAWLVACACIKQENSPFRPAYDKAREQYETAVHDKPCHRCGPSGSPAQAGSPLSRAHQHARGIRAVAKAVLEDLWLEARALHAAN